MMYSTRKICTVLVLAFFALSAGAMAAAPISTIEQGNTVFLGEEGLDVSAALKEAYYGAACGHSLTPSEAAAPPPLTTIGWWASAADIYNTAPSQTIDLGSGYQSMMVSPSEFAGYTGNWYLVDHGMVWAVKADGCGCSESGCTAALVFTVQDPSLEIRIEDATVGVDAGENGWITTGDEVAFRILTNLHQITQRPGVSSVPIDIVVESPDGALYTALINQAGTETSIRGIPVSSTPFDTGPIWDTGRPDLYPYGTYAVWAECNVNNMKDNYPVSGKTYTPDWGLLDQERNPLIVTSVSTTVPTTEATGVPATARTVTATTVQAVATTPPAAVTTPGAVPSIISPAPPVPSSPTRSPGFTIMPAGAALLLALVWFVRKK